MSNHFDTVIVGGGQSGLAVSYLLTEQGRSHVVLEKNRIGEAWRTGKWESFTLVSPNWTLKLPGFDYQGDDPDGYYTCEEVVRYIEAYVAHFNPPVRTGVTVQAVQGDGAGGFIVETSAGLFTAENVVVATGAFQQPKIPPYSGKIDPRIEQLHTSQYRNPDGLPEGAVLIVGSGQSGCQIADELADAGRKVYLCTGSAVCIPRRYRGLDIFHWVQRLGLFDQTVDTLETAEERFAANPQITGKNGGQTLSLHRFYEKGVTLLGRLTGGQGTMVNLAPNVRENVANADKPMVDITTAIDKYIAEQGLNAPETPLPALEAAYAAEQITELDLAAAGINTIIWAAGYTVDFSWVKFPIFDEFGYPIQQRGVTEQPGLYFIGLLWLHKSKSNLFLGVAEDAAYITEQIASRTPHPAKAVLG